MRDLIRADIDNDPIPRMPRRRVRHTLVLVAQTEANRLRKRIVHALASCLRPWRRRLFIILRPLAVFILLRKPQADLRQRLLG